MTPAHLRYAGCGPDEQLEALRDIVLRSDLLRTCLEAARELDLPDWWIVSGAVYNTVWNVLSARDPLHGIKDVDLFYFDAGDLAYEAEDIVIRRAALMFAKVPIPVEVRNQARVHLWFEQHFGIPYNASRSSTDGIDRFASRTHAVGVRLDGAGTLDVYAPYGLDDIFSFRIAPNRVLANRATHEAKARRALAHWPELTVEPW